MGPIEGAPKPIQEIASKCLRIDHVDFQVCMIILEQHVMYKHWQAFLFRSSDPRLGSCVPGEKVVQFIRKVYHLSCMIYFGGWGGTLSTDPIGLSTNLIGRSTNPIGLSTVCPRFVHGTFPLQKTTRNVLGNLVQRVGTFFPSTEFGLFLF